MEKRTRKRSCGYKLDSSHYTILESIRESGALPKLSLGKYQIQRRINTLKKRGLIKRVGYATWELTEKEVAGISHHLGLLPPLPLNPHLSIRNEGVVKPDFIRAHNLVFKLKVISPLSWVSWLEAKGLPFQVLKNNILRVVFQGFKVWLCKDKLIVYFPPRVDFIASDVAGSLRLCVMAFYEWLPGFEAYLGLGLRLNGSFVWSLGRKHLSLVKNALAQDYLAKGQKLKVYDERGLWLLIDNSLNLEELEAVRTRTNTTEAQKLQAWLNDYKANPMLTSDIIKTFGAIAGNFGAVAANQALAASNINKLIEAIKQLGGVI